MSASLGGGDIAERIDWLQPPPIIDDHDDVTRQMFGFARKRKNR